MSIQALNWAFSQDSIENSGARFVLVVLCNYANEEGQCYPSRETIARKTSMSVRSVQSHINWLSEAGYLKWKNERKDDNRQTPNVYQLPSAIFAPRDEKPSANIAEAECKSRTEPSAKSAQYTSGREPSEETGRDAPVLEIHLGTILAGVMSELGVKKLSVSAEREWTNEATLAFENGFPPKAFLECFSLLRKLRPYAIKPNYVTDGLPELTKLRNAWKAKNKENGVGGQALPTLEEKLADVANAPPMFTPPKQIQGVM